MSTPLESVPAILADLPNVYRGPGGVAAVLKDGELAGEVAWGYSNLQTRTPITPDTLFPICSVTKQMVCGLLTDLENNPTPTMLAHGDPPSKQIADELHRLLGPKLPGVEHLPIRVLCNNQSGIRDYWASTVLYGAQPDGHFSIKDHGPLILDRVKSFHCPPGTQYHYSNTNYFLVGRIIENITKQPLADLLKERIFDPAGMKTARLVAHAEQYADHVTAYVGTEPQGFYVAKNCIEWAGDAGIMASLSDMIAYEKFVDRCRDDPKNWYSLNSQQQTYNDGTPALYGYGLARANVGGVLTIGHGGALRGYRLHRLYAPDHRVSVVAMINQEHLAPTVVTGYLLKRTLGIAEEKKAAVSPSKDWFGCFLDPETKLQIGIAQAEDGKISLLYHPKPEKLTLTDPNSARSDDMVAKVDGSSLYLEIESDNRKIHAQRVADVKIAATSTDFQGSFQCTEIDSVFHCSGQGSMLYGSFDGCLGKGPIHMMRSLATDVWALTCPIGMDHTPPGDWTIAFERGADGKVSGVTIGCWLARSLKYARIA